MASAGPPTPDSVRVWRGWREMELSDFHERLGTVFIPATVEMQIDAGLDAYIPSVPAGLPDKPDTVPDETAILFWDSQQTYLDGFETLAVRTYTLTHNAVYTPASHANFPVRFGGVLAPDEPCHLTTAPADWMHGEVRHLIAGRPDETSAEEFRSAASGVLADGAADGAAGALVCVGADYLVYWELAGSSGSGAIAALVDLCGWTHVVTAEPTRLRAGLWDRWPGLQVDAGTSLNMRFERRWERQGRP